MSDRVHEFNEVHIDQDCSTMSGEHSNELFFNCTFCKLNDLSLKNCDLNKSRFTTQQVRDALGFTLTLGCHSFRGVEFSPLLMDLYLTLATMTIGNDDKREKLLEVIGKDRAEALLRMLRGIE